MRVTMDLPNGESRPTRVGTPRLASIEGVPTYALYSDEQLLADRGRLRDQLDELTAHPGQTPGVAQLLVSIEQEIERITDELLQRARSRHPSSRGLDTRGNVGPVAHPPPAD